MGKDPGLLYSKTDLALGLCQGRLRQDIGEALSSQTRCLLVYTICLRLCTKRLWYHRDQALPDARLEQSGKSGNGLCQDRLGQDIGEALSSQTRCLLVYSFHTDNPGDFVAGIYLYNFINQPPAKLAWVN